MEHPFSNILLVTEHTEFDSGSERVALEMAKRCDIPLSVVVPVVSNPVFEIEAHALADRTEHEIAVRLDAFREIAKGAGVTIKVHARRGESPAEEIVQEATELKSDLIVIRRRGRRSFIAELLVGEMVTRIVTTSPCSVLMVPRACGMWSRGILVAVDGQNEQALKAAAGIAVLCELPLYVLCVAHGESSREDAERIAFRNVETAKGIGAKAKGMVLAGRVCDAILEAPVDADLVVVGMGGMHFGGTAQRVVAQSEKPVLAVHG